jgi:hypothetical protein
MSAAVESVADFGVEQVAVLTGICTWHGNGGLDVEAGVDSVGGFAPRKPVNAVQRMRQARMQLQGRPDQEARPLLKVSFTRKGKSSSKFVKKEDLPDVKPANCRRKLKSERELSTVQLISMVQ